MPLAWCGHQAHLGLPGCAQPCWGQAARLGQEPWCRARTSLVRLPLLLKFLIYSKELMALLMSEVPSVFTRAENLLSKSKYCAKTESQNVMNL